MDYTFDKLKGLVFTVRNGMGIAYTITKVPTTGSGSVEVSWATCNQCTSYTANAALHYLNNGDWVELK